MPLLSGLDGRAQPSLWGAFVLINAGCAGRVVLRILTDWLPAAAYPLVGFTGFVAIAGFAWWGLQLWRVMNRAKTGRPKMLHLPVPIAAR